MAINKVTILKAALIVLLIVIAFFAGRCSCGNITPGTIVESRTDTLIIRDTVLERYPVAVEKVKTDTMLIVISDTVTIRDTTYLLLEREQKHYSSNDYDAWISGYRPELDSIRIFPETKYITNEKIISVPSRKRWGLGLQVGYGVGLQGGKPIGTPYIGIGVSYNLLQW